MATGTQGQQVTPRCRAETCHRALRDPESVARGYGPVCWRRHHPPTPRTAARAVVVPTLRGPRDVRGQLAFDLDDLDDKGGDGL